MEYIDSFNEEQKLAINTTSGPVLVLSGAGTGKTSVLTARIIHILNTGLALPWQILALTFTNKAANEMRNRISKYENCAQYSTDIWMGTFHSICLRILRANHDKIGLRKDFLIYGTDDQKSVLKRVINSLELDIKKYSPADFVEKISTIKDKGITDFEILSLDKVTKSILYAYNDELTKLGALDFGDIILYTIKLFNTNENILLKYQQQFKYILVDEFQDTNAAQMNFIKLLTKGIENPNICCVGDDDQSIYSWRGAEIKNILHFEKTYPGTQIIRLETNYRSTGNILSVANSLIKHNTGRLGKDLYPAPKVGTGEPVYVLTLATEWEEARFIADTLEKYYKDNFSDCAILIRAGTLSRAFEEEFTARGLQYKLVGAQKFYDRAEIRDAIAYTRLLVYPFDDMSFERIITKPSRKIGSATLVKIRNNGDCLMNGLKYTNFSASQQATVNQFLDAFNFDWQNMLPQDAVQQLLENTGYLKMWQDSKDVDAPERLEHIHDLVSGVISKYDNLYDFLEHAALMTADDNDIEINTDNVVNIMTIHAAKGLEFDTVFLPAWEEGVFPNEKTTKCGEIEEERRLAYVAITRAKKRVVITNAVSRSLFGQRDYNLPSRFIDEIDKRYVNQQATSFTSSKQVNMNMNTNKTIVGKMVVHSELGQGVIIADNGNILVVAFKNKGIKNIARDYVTIL